MQSRYSGEIRDPRASHHELLLSGSGLVAVMRYSAAASELEVVWNLTLSVGSVNYRAPLIRFTYG